MVPALGLTVIEFRAAGVTVRVVVPVTELKVAVTVTGPPTATALATPVARIVAIALFEVLHVTLPVMFCVLLSV
jgi:hypothetical protein